MNVSILPQLSMRSYKDGKWLVSKDSQFNRICDWIEALPDDWEWSMILPKWDQCDSGWGERLPPRVTTVGIDWPENVLLQRYWFPVREIRELIEEFKPDVIL